MKIAIALIVGLAAGFLFAVAVVDLWQPKAREFVLTADLDLEARYFFAPAKPPTRAYIKQGSVVELQGQHSNADYILIRGVIAHRDFLRITRPLDTHTIPSVASESSIRTPAR